MFVCSLDVLSSAFQLVGGKDPGGLGLEVGHSRLLNFMSGGRSSQALMPQHGREWLRANVMEQLTLPHHGEEDWNLVAQVA